MNQTIDTEKKTIKFLLKDKTNFSNKNLLDKKENNEKIKRKKINLERTFICKFYFKINKIIK